MLTNVWFYLNSRINNEKGQGLVEYGLILALVGVVVAGALTLLGTSVESLINNIVGKLGG
jgi:pilus assembly protein Flp/PilA